jgi:hypothetical protein
MEDNKEFYPSEEDVAALALKFDKARIAHETNSLNVDAAEGYDYDPETGSIFGRRRSSVMVSSSSPTSLGLTVEEAPVNNESGHFIILPTENQSVVIQAIQQCNVLDLLHLIKAVPIADRQDFVNQHDSDGNPLIFHAVYFEESGVDMLTLLLDYGANPNLQNNRRNTAMHLACQRNHRAAIRALIVYDSSVQMDNWEHLQPYQMVSDVKEEQAIMQNFVNTCFEKYEMDIEQRILIKVSLPMRSYYRSVFDEMDLRERGYLDLIEVRLFLESLHAAGGVEKAPPTARAFFDTWDRSKTGKLLYPDFIHGLTLHEMEKERLKKKQLKQQRIAKRRAAAKAAAAKK